MVKGLITTQTIGGKWLTLVVEMYRWHCLKSFIFDWVKLIQQSEWWVRLMSTEKKDDDVDDGDEEKKEKRRIKGMLIKNEMKAC